MIEQQKIVEAVYKAVDEINQTLPESKRIEKSLDVELSGPSGALDSMGLVNMVVEAEEQIEDAFGVTVNLGDQQAAASEQNPLATLGTLVAYIGTRLEQETES